MNIQAIRLFLHVIREGSLTSGARTLNMSQSAASRLLSGLERETNLQLFSRASQRLRPTSEGEQFFKECNRALLAVDELPRTARRLASGARARLRLVAGSRVAASLVAPAIGRFAKRYPDLEVDVRFTTSLETPTVVAERAFDLAIGSLMPRGMPAIDVEPLLELPTVAIMRRSHPLAERTSLRAADIAGHRLVAHSAGDLRDSFERIFLSEGIELEPRFTTNSIDLGCHIALHTGAIMIADPLVALTIDEEAFALVPIKPTHMAMISTFTSSLQSVSQITKRFKVSLQEEARAIEARLAGRMKRWDGPASRPKRKASNRP